MATTFKRADSKWWWINYIDRHGDRKKKGLKGVTDKATALKIAVRRESDEADIRLGLIDPEKIEAAKMKSESVDSVVRRWISDSEPTTEQIAMVNRFINFKDDNFTVNRIGDYGRRKARQHVARFLKSVHRGGVQKRRVNQHRWILIILFDWCDDEELIDRNPASSTSLKRFWSPEDDEKKRPPAALTIDQYHAMLKTPRGYWYEFLAWTGMRTTEALRVNIEDLDEIKGVPVLRVRSEVSGKNRWEGVLPLAPSLVKSIRDRVGMRVGGAIFKDIPSDRSNRRRAMQRDLKAAGINQSTKSDGHKRITQNSFRHTFTTWAQAAEVSGDQISMLRRDKGKGSERLRLFTYTEFDQLVPTLLASLKKMERWHKRQRKSA